jgi:hypothetical protein
VLAALRKIICIFLYGFVRLLCVVQGPLHYRLRLVTFRMKVLQNGRLFRFLKMFGARLAGSSVTNTASLVGVSRAAVSMLMTTYTNHGKISTKRKSGRKPKQGEIYRRTLKKTLSKKP